MSETIQKSKVSGIKVTLAVVPALLIVSICVALYLGANADKEEKAPYEGEVTIAEMAGYLEKTNEVIGERRIDTAEGQKAFRQIRAMTMGALGEQNLGYETYQTQIDSVNGLLWPVIWIQAGDREAREVVVMAVPQAESGTGPAFAYGFAEYLTTHPLPAAVRIVFYPPLVEGDFGDWLWKRCGDDGEKLLAFFKVTGGDPEERKTFFSGPADSGILEGLQESKLWGEGFGVRNASSFEVRLIERGGVSQEEHARRLILAMPVVKELVDRLGMAAD